MPNTTSILGITVTTLSQKVIEEQIARSLEKRRLRPLRRLIFTPNSEMLASSDSFPKFASVLDSSFLNIPDGYGVVWASLGKIKNRITGVDLMERLILQAGQHGWKVFLLGSKPGIAKEAADKMRQRIPSPHPKFEMATLAGPQNLSTASMAEVSKTIDSINKFRPNFLFVGFGHSKQEFFLSSHKEELWFDYAMGVGGAFDMISGKIVRAPVWIQKSGLEWLWRFLLEPKRWRRQILIFKFPLLVLKSYLKKF